MGSEELFNFHFSWCVSYLLQWLVIQQQRMGVQQGVLKGRGNHQRRGWNSRQRRAESHPNLLASHWKKHTTQGMGRKLHIFLRMMLLINISTFILFFFWFFCISRLFILVLFFSFFVLQTLKNEEIDPKRTTMRKNSIEVVDNIIIFFFKINAIKNTD